MHRIHLAGFSAGQTSFASAASMTAASACLAFLYLAARNVADLPPMQVAFFASLFGFALMAPGLAASGAFPPPTARMGTHLLRAGSGLAAIICIFVAVRLLPLAEATALSFAAPVFAALGATLFTGETVSRQRWIATCVGFAGVIVILQPGSSSFGLGGAIALLSAVCTALATLTVRSLSRTEPVGTIVFYFMALMIPLSGAASLPFWRTPGAHHWPWLALIGGTITVAQFLLTRSLRQADASFAVPFMYTQLIFVSLLGFVLYGEMPALATFLGAAIIFASSIYLALSGRPARPRQPGAARWTKFPGRPA
jgi:drug/metabolite transporter (DMT)-like permease